MPKKPSPGGASTQKRSSVLTKIREKFKEKPATREEVEQLGLNAKREVYKTQIQRAKSSRPSKFDFLGGEESRSRGSRRNDNTGSFLFGGGGKSNGGSFLDSNWSPSLSMFGGSSEKPTRRGKPQRSGLEDLF